MNSFRLSFLFFTFILSISAGEIRKWTSADGSRHFEAEFISRKNNEVTLLRADNKELTLDLEKLHDDDRRWLNMKHPLGKDGAGEEMPAENAIFDTLMFGDTRDTVGAKLKASRIVESSVDGIFLGRTGLNGIYRTRHMIGGLYCYLFFDWTETGGLKEITLQTENKLVGEYDQVLKPCWEECIPLITTIHGKPMQTGKIAAAEALEDGRMLASCLWSMECGGSVLLGTAKEGLGYQVVVRFTQEKLGVNRNP